MGQPAERLPTFEETYSAIEGLRPGLTGEILRPGEVRVMSRPGSGHRLFSLRLVRALGDLNVAFGRGSWWIEVEAEIRFGDLLYVPDLSGWRTEEKPEFVLENPISVPPDWVCEILSRSTQRGDRIDKLPTYIDAGVAHVWIVDPEAQTIEVYSGEAGRPVLVAATRREAAVLPPFDLPIDVAALLR